MGGRSLWAESVLLVADPTETFGEKGEIIGLSLQRKASSLFQRFIFQSNIRRSSVTLTLVH